MDNLYSAVNNTVATIHNCEEEPIHIPGSIQPHGFLFAINKKGNIALCSANIKDFLSLPPEYFLSKPCKDVLPPDLYEAVERTGTNSNIDRQHVPIRLTINNQDFDCFLRPSGNYLCVECIPSPENSYTVYDLFLNTGEIFKGSGDNSNLSELSNLVAQKIRNVIQYDRVMIYRFSEDYSGHVYAESIGDGIESFLDLHYPATDIPQQARDLYVKNLTRLIPDIHYTPVPVVTLQKEFSDPENLDLSNVHLRSVSPIHIQYLKNMGLGASFSISLIKDGKLWGLVACHNNEPKYLSYTKQTEAWLLSQILSLQIAVQETAEKYRLSKRLDVYLKKLTDYLQREENFVELHFENMKEVLSVANTGGAALAYKNKIYRLGNTPSDAEIIELQNFLRGQSKINFSTDELSKIFPPAANYTASAAGLLFHQLNVSGNPCLYWFRPSADKVITWAGNPEKDSSQSSLNPRSSFAAWKELKKGISKPWLEPELEHALQFAHLLQRNIFLLQQREEDLRYRKLNEQLVRANKELENINWISTHDLKEPLRKIQIFASLMDSPQSMTSMDNMRQSIDRIRSAASKMQRFIDDLLIYSRMSDTVQAYETVDLNILLNEVVTELTEEKKQGLFEMEAEKLPSIHISRFQAMQLFINLIGNAVKFKKENEVQRIRISYEQVADINLSNDETINWHKISIADSGVGFNAEMAQSIFDIFKKAHSGEKFSGTGVGLSICRKIMENHGGKIFAEGKENNGAVFTLFFPKTHKQNSQ